MSPSPVAPPLSRTKRFVIAAVSAINDAACRSDGTVNRRLVSLLDARVAASAKPFRGVRTADVPVDLSRDLWFRLFVPLPFLTANGYRHRLLPRRRVRIPLPDSYLFDDVCRRICRTVHAVVVSVNYRLAPEHRCPAQYETGFTCSASWTAAASCTLTPRLLILPTYPAASSWATPPAETSSTT
ncbi:unnamed protein product [Musa acuminata subsp. burmannicoides]